MDHCRFAFCASTGRTATMFLANTLDAVPGVLGLHEGHTPGEPPIPRLPLINLQNLKAWHESAYADQTVAESRDHATLSTAAAGAELLVDLAYYNAPLLVPIAKQHPDSVLFVIFRRCEGFVRSATIVSGEDLQPAGWPDRSKSLTDREKFVALGRLRPKPGGDDAEQWSNWSAIQRNTWLWHSINTHLLHVVESLENCHRLHYEHLVADPTKFWTGFLEPLGILSDSTLNSCVARSGKKLNHRSSYQVGPIDTWGEAELALYERLARPLEQRLYD